MAGTNFDFGSITIVKVGEAKYTVSFSTLPLYVENASGVEALISFLRGRGIGSAEITRIFDELDQNERCVIPNTSAP